MIFGTTRGRVEKGCTVEVETDRGNYFPVCLFRPVEAFARVGLEFDTAEQVWVIVAAECEP